jgi:hypothetical protein
MIPILRRTAHTPFAILHIRTLAFHVRALPAQSSHAEAILAYSALSALRELVM